MLKRCLGPVVVLVCLSGSAVAAGLDRTELEHRAEAAARHLVAVETVEGRFFYEFDFLLSRFTADDNIVRQAGAGFILNQFLYESGKPAFIEPAARTIAYYAAKSVPHGDGQIISEDGTLAGGRAGALALALLAELYHTRATGTDFRPDLRLDWLQGIAAQQLANGGIAQRPGDSSEDSYATGETWLALAHYLDLFPGTAEAEAVLVPLEALVMEKYLATPDRMFAHWGMMAAAQRFATTGDVRYREFIERLARAFIREMVPVTSPTANACAILEGLGAAAGAVANGGDPALAKELRARLDHDLPISRALQIEALQTQVSFGTDRFYQDPKLANFVGAFRNGYYILRTRIDFTQHCLSALLRYRALLPPQQTTWKN